MLQLQFPQKTKCKNKQTKKGNETRKYKSGHQQEQMNSPLSMQSTANH